MKSKGGKEVKTKILIAEDDSSTRMLLRAMITQWNYTVVEASTGEEAWEILQGPDAPKIVTVDWMMPKIDGLTLCRMSKNLPSKPYMILLTSMSGPANIIQALDAGADDFLTKPFNYAELRSRLFAGQRIISVTNKLERIIDSQKLNTKLSEAVHRMSTLSELINKKYELLHSCLKHLNDLESVDHKALKKILDMIKNHQKKLMAEISNLKM